MHSPDSRSDSALHDLIGRTAVVTGASSGVGRAIAMALAEAGADVVVHCRARETLANEVAHEITQLGHAARVVVADLAETAAQDRLVESAWNWRGGVDLWINNAGADVLTGAAAQWSFEEKLQRLWQVDVVGTMRLSRQIGQRMISRAAAGATIINVGWDQAEQGMGGDSGEMFAAIKGAIMAFTRSLAQSLAPHVRVNCVAPGWIRTSWGDQASEYWQQRAIRESLVGRWGSPLDIAQAVRFLVSPAASFISGQIVKVNGGFRYGS